MTAPELLVTELSSRPDNPLVVLGPSLGTSTKTLWQPVAELLTEQFHLVAWDLPGHGADTETSSRPFTVPDLAAGVVAAVEPILAKRGEPGGTFCYAGVSAGGAVGIQLLLDIPARLNSAVLMCTAARIGDPESWRERAAQVRSGGTSSVRAGSVERWFAPGFAHRRPDVVDALVEGLIATSDEGYALTCQALSEFDARDRLAEIDTTVLAVGGDNDTVTPVDGLEQIARDTRNGSLVVLDNVAHLAPVEAPRIVAHLLESQFAQTGDTVADLYDNGMRVRREVLGDAHVDRATAAATDLTEDFQEFITKYAWGGIWTRPGLDRRSRSMITLTALIARGHHDELAMHVRAARTNGLSRDEITEVIMQSAIYCGVPDANSAFKIAEGVLQDLED